MQYRVDVTLRYLLSVNKHWCQLTTILCLQAVNEFQSLVSQVQKSSSMAEKVVYSIMTASLVKDPAVQGTPDVMDLQELYDHLERFRLEVCYCTMSCA